MSKNIILISTSFRNNSNSEILAGAFIDGAKSVGNNAEKITLADKSIALCKGCLVCQKTKKCVINDDAIEIADTVFISGVGAASRTSNRTMLQKIYDMGKAA